MILKAIIGIVLGFAGNAMLIYQKLLIYTEATKQPLVAGGTIGLLVGTIVGFLLPTKVYTVVGAGGLAVLCIATFNSIVEGERSFSGRSLALYLLAFAIAAGLSFLGTTLYSIFEKQKKPQGVIGDN